MVWIDGIKKSPTRSDFPPHQLATINSPNLRLRAASTRPLPPISSSPSSLASGSLSVTSSPATRKSSSFVLGRFKARIRDVDRPDEKIIVNKPETLDSGAYTSLLPVTANSLPRSPGSSKRQTPVDTPPIGVRPNSALPRMMSSTKTQTGSSLPRVTDTETSTRSGNSTSGVTTVDLQRTRVARPTTLMPAAAASVQRRRLPSPPHDHDDAADVDSQQRRPDASIGTVTSPHSAATSPHVTSGRCQGTYVYLPSY